MLFPFGLVSPVPGAGLLLALCLALALGLGWLEWRRRARWRRTRALAAGAATLALAVLGLAPARRVAAPGGRLLLVTAGAERDAVRRLADSLGVRRVAYLPDAAAAAPAGARPLADARLLRARHPDVATLDVAGWGPEPAAWPALAGLAVRLHPAPLPAGVTAVVAPTMVPFGEAVTLRGAVMPGARAGWIRLEGDAGAVDSARVDAAQRSFALHARPRAAGPGRWILRGDTALGMPAETLGVDVDSIRAPRVLVVESAPSFETRFLAQWLARQGGTLAVRTRVTRDVWRTEFRNRPRRALTPLTPALLGEFDVVVTDGRVLAALAAPERAALHSAIADSGRGLLVRADSATVGPADFFRAARVLPARSADGGGDALVRPIWTGRATAPRTPVAAAPWTLQPGFGAAALVRAAPPGARAALVVAAPRGAGWVALDAVATPSRWALAGEPEAFAGYWSHVLGAIAAGGGRGAWRVEPGVPLVDQPVVLTLATRDSAPLGLVLGPAGARDTIFLARDPLESTRWRGTWWPRAAGWHALTGGGARLNVLVGAREAWPARRAARRLAAAQAAAGADAAPAPESGAGATAGSAGVIERPVPLLPAFLLFLGCAGVLWVTDPRRA
ncbi:MAG TPA: hypothetical protein VFS40_07925 [Gemmatimonadales bacterium]|nr:hypothetical protein [Gemmatimonadales bacterium]